MADEDASVQVFCRVRPPNEREGGGAKSSCVSVAGDARSVVLTSRHAAAPRAFTFDRAFGEHAAQRDVFAAAGAPITRACLQGYNGTIFAYGQTGSGKTFTMQGPERGLAASAAPQDAELRGLVPRVFDFLFSDRSSARDGATHTFACSFLEIYNERVFDLLDGGAASASASGAGLQVRENGRAGVFVEGLTESVVADAAQAAQLMAAGAQNRRVGQTAMNRESSRSHSVFVLQIRSQATTADGVTRVRSARFNLVDLAGSERQRSTEAAGERLKEAGSINKSLSALGNVIMGLVEQSAGKNRHVHYRDSKLTFLLKDSLGGNSRTSMIATVSPADDSAFETLSTLKFAQRAKLIRNNAVINEDATGSVAVLQEEIQRLRLQLRHAQLETGAHGPRASPLLALALAPPPPPPAADAQCDPAVDGRFRDLEAAFATSVEKNGQLKRANERLKAQEAQLQALCSEMKRSMTHLRLVLRLRQSSASDSSSSDELEKAMVDYEPSVDAIEWRLKYEELEESYAELQDEIQQKRRAEQFAGLEHGAHVEGEVERLNLMLLALTKQLASVVRDKHELRDRLVRVTEPAASDGDDVEMAPATLALVESDKLATQLRDAMATQAHALNAKVNAALAARDAAAEKAREAALELLAVKQKEAAWGLQVTERDIRLQDSARLLRQAEEARALAGAQLQQERQQRLEERVRASQEHDRARLALDAKLSDALTSKRQLERERDALVDEAARLRAVRDALAQQASAQEEQIAALTLALAAKSDELARESQQFALELEQWRAQVARSSDQIAAMDAAHRQALQQKADEVAQLHARSETAALEAAQRETQLQRTHADVVRSMEDASAAREEEHGHTRSALENEASALSQQAARLEAQVAGLSNTLNEAAAKAEALDQQLREAQRRSDEQRAELATRAAALEALQVAHDALLEERERLRADVATRVEGIRALEQSRAALQAAVATRDEAARTQAIALASLADELSAAQLREGERTRDLEAAEQLRVATAAEHSEATARLQETHTAESAALQTRLEAAKREAAQLEAQLREVASAASALQEARDRTSAALEGERASAQQQLAALERDVSRLRSELVSAASAAAALEQQRDEQQQRLRADAEQRGADLATLQTALDGARADVGAQTAAVAALEQRQAELQARCEQLEAAAASSAAEVATLSDALADELAAAAVTHATQSAALKESEAVAEVRGREVVAAKAANAELSTAVAGLRATLEALEQTNRELAADRQTQAALAATSEQLERRSAELAATTARVDAELREAAAARATLAGVTADWEASKARVVELELLVAQLRSAKQALERETQAQRARLEHMAKANDKLVGHDNKRQKIQYHFKVKEENNRLLGEVRQLTDDRFRLQTQLDKLRLALKEKENVVGGGVKRPLSAASSSSASTSSAVAKPTTTTAASSARPGAKKLIPVAAGLGGLESSSLATKKRTHSSHSHSRLER